MPIYEYQCGGCGGFSAWGDMARSGNPAPCPGCGGAADRVLSATAGGAAGWKPAGGEPRLVQRRADGPPPAPRAHGHGGRPWMMGH